MTLEEKIHKSTLRIEANNRVARIKILKEAYTIPNRIKYQCGKIANFFYESGLNF